MLAIRAVVLLWGVIAAVSGDVGGVHGNRSSGQPPGRLPPLLRHAGQPDPRANPRTGPVPTTGLRTGPRKGPRADPSFMAQLFHHLAGADGARKVGPAPYGATTIRFYRSQETDVPFHLRHESGGLAVSFNVSSLQDAAVVTSAQLRVFRRARTPSSCRLYVFRASPDGSRRLVSRRRLPAGSAGWEEFDVTQSFSRHALQRDDTVLQLVLKFKCRHEASGNRTGPRNATLPSLVGPRNDTHHPSLVLYLRESEETRAGNARPRRPCRRHELYVDFTELGWDWIIAPAGYRAFYCRGGCPAIMGQHLRPTNHAVVQNILGTVRARLPPARCVPDSLRPISVLHYEENGSIVYKEYPDMVAGSCACR
ncbi:PREDICTED: bone morphogenetic protein 2-B-like [Branchiostoma belcheri]|uniref:Bone morphogenetic protein 2-B-like n=1 Tax=Branchiostoma belcheri TaxID=7741 RepID=A0A6P4ZAY0_BRABE|nr:PREDICTED: bone morphogenetic protein 2-B-like [Branchiostoma belcheri]